MRVLELSDAESSAAFAGKLFQRWGWEVIKAEAASRPTPRPAEDSYVNGGKRRVQVDFRTPEGRASLEGLAVTCDILITDATASETREYRLLELGGSDGPIVRTSITPFGLTGPYSSYPATEATLLAMSGLTSLIGDPDRAPLTLPEHFAAYQTGIFAYTATLAAYLQTEHRAVPPTTIEMSALETLMSMGGIEDTQWVENRRLYRRSGNRGSVSAGTMLPCADGWFGFTLIQEFWLPFALMLDRPDIIEGHVFSTNDGRLKHRDAFEALVSERLSGRPKHEIFTEGQETWRIPVGYAATLEDCLKDRHLEVRGFWRPLILNDGTATVLKTAGSPFRFLGEDPPAEWMPALPGADSPSSLAAAAPRRSKRSAESALAPPATKPLAGVRVLDLTRVWAGPLAARILADLGAEVICVEAPTGRGPGAIASPMPTYQKGGQTPEPWNRQPLFNKRHRNRKSLCIDLKQLEGRKVFLDLVAKSDVLIENFSARAMSRLGLGHEHLTAANPALISLSMPAFGTNGPYADYVGYGAALEPMIGLPALMGYSLDQPRVSGQALPDPIAGACAAAAILTALARRHKTAKGARMEFSQHEAGISLFGQHFINRQLEAREPDRLGNAHPLYAPHGIYPCEGEDEWIALAAEDVAQWEALCDVTSVGLGLDARFATPAGRLEHRAALDEAISLWTRPRDKFSVMQVLLEAGVPAGPVMTVEESLADAHVIERGYVAQLTHPVTGRQAYDGWPFTFNGERGYREWRAAPTLGEDNWEILSSIVGLDDQAIALLTERHVVATRPPV